MDHMWYRFAWRIIKKTRPRTDLAFYDIVDVTPGSNSDFIRSLPNDVVHEIRQSKLLPTPVIDNADRMKQYIIDFIKTKNFREYVDEIYVKTRNNNIMKFVWDYLNILTSGNLSHTSNAQSLPWKAPGNEYFFGEKCLFASSEDRNREKTDEEDRNAGRKIDIIWSMKPTDLEFSISEVSGRQISTISTISTIIRTFLMTNSKIAKMLKVIFNRIVRKYTTWTKVADTKLLLYIQKRT